MKLQSALLISDLHLTPTMPRTAQRFVDFCENEATKVEALFILGDLFEYWVGDDAYEHAPFQKEVARQLKSLSQKGVKIYFMKGNRDFLLGSAFAKLTGWTDIDEPTTIELGDQQWTLVHGDSLCTADASYQNFRNWVRKSWIQNLFLKMPVAWRKQIAENLRSKSTASYQRGQRYTPDQTNQKSDVTKSACADLVRQSKCTQIIHGHTHRPGLYQEAFNDTSWKRWVLSDWDLDHPETVLPKANALRIDESGIAVLDLVRN